MITLFQFNNRMFDNNRGWDNLPGNYFFVLFEGSRGKVNNNRKKYNHSNPNSFYSVRHCRPFKLQLIKEQITTNDEIPF